MTVATGTAVTASTAICTHTGACTSHSMPSG